MKFENKTVVVTGGASGIGRVMCLRFAREGAAVVVNYSKSETQAAEVVREIERTGGRASPTLEQAIEEGSALAFEVQGKHREAIAAYLKSVAGQ